MTRCRTAAALAALALAITAPAQAERLTVLYSNSNLMKPVHDDFKARFERAHPGDAVRFEPALEYTDALAITLRQAVVGSLHDIGYYGLPDVCLLAERGIARPLDALIRSDPGWPALGIPDSALDITRCHGVTYGVPLGASFMVVIYNKKLVAEAGGDPDRLPTTWDDILVLAKRIHSRSGGIAMNYMASSSWSFMTLVQSQGGRILTPDGTDIAFDSQEGVRALQILADIGTARGHVDMTKAQGRQSFVSGTLGILVESSSGLAEYRRATKDSFDIGVVPFPLAKNGGLPASGMAGVLQTGPGPRERLAWDYLEYAETPDAQALMGKATGFLPFSRVALESPDKLAAYYAEFPEMRTAAASVAHAAAWPGFPGPNSLKIHEVVTDTMQKVYTGAQAPKPALDELAAKTRALLK